MRIPDRLRGTASNPFANGSNARRPPNRSAASPSRRSHGPRGGPTPASPPSARIANSPAPCPLARRGPRRQHREDREAEDRARAWMNRRLEVGLLRHRQRPRAASSAARAADSARHPAVDARPTIAPEILDDPSPMRFRSGIGQKPSTRTITASGTSETSSRRLISGNSPPKASSLARAPLLVELAEEHPLQRPEVVRRGDDDAAVAARIVIAR